MRTDHGSSSWDVVVVGAGATGGWAAKKLTEAGLRVLLLEAGPELDAQKEFRRIALGALPRAADGGVALSNLEAVKAAGESPLPNDRQWIQQECCAFEPATRHLFVDDIDNPYATAEGKPFTWIRMRLVGGRTALWNRVALRLSDRELNAAALDGWGECWPISYDDLRPSYDEVERFIGVYGNADGLPGLPDGCFLEPPALSRTEQGFKREVEELRPPRRVVRLRQVGLTQPGVDLTDPRAVPYFCSAASTIAAAKQTGRTTLRSNAVVSHIVRNGRRAAGVAFVDSQTGERHEACARVVLLCASALESTRILLNSGLTGSSGALGHYLTDHVAGLAVVARRKRKADERPDAPGERRGLYVPNFSNLPGHRAKFVRGFGVQVELRVVADEVHYRSVAFGEMLPRRENHVRIEQSLEDRWGIPALRIDATHSENEASMSREMVAEMIRMAECGGFEITFVNSDPAPPGRSVHECGTARMGREPGQSVLNPFNACWEMPNLFVTDGAAFPSVGYQNPTLTMMALTVRTCGHVLAEMNAGRL